MVPSVHIRALATWVTIFPLVTLGMHVLQPFSAGWPPVLRAFALTAAIVPLAVYVVVPRLLNVYVKTVQPVIQPGRTRR